MPAEQEACTIREAVGVFDSPDKLQEAIDDLMSSGFDRAELSLLAAEVTRSGQKTLTMRSFRYTGRSCLGRAR